MRSKDLITINEPMSLAAESYKMFRSNLNYMNIDTDKQVIMFTSSLPGEGKTTTIANLAVAFASEGKKTLLIECDLRRSRLHNVFALNQLPGLTNILLDGQQLSDVVNTIEEVPGLDVLTAGALPPSPAEVLGTHALERLITEARNHYDKILIDGPPVLSVTDTLVINRLVDGVVLIVAANKTRRNVVGKAIKTLDKIEANLLGILISKMDIKRNAYYNYYAGTYQYGHQDKKSKRSKKKKGIIRREDVVESSVE